jgi:putative intracellular protease/amidase
LPPCPARLLWDTGGLWSLMTLEAAWQRGLALEPISAAQVAAGGLAGARLLVVPGGWAARKKKALGAVGAAAIGRFISQGGTYLGFCGGAGLALSVDDGLGLVPLSRASGAQRLPGLSGPVKITPSPQARQHPLWQQGQTLTAWPVWWPGQFEEPHDDSISVLARYHGPTPELRLSGPTQDPEALWEQPAVIEARIGSGRLLLSYPHLDTPGEEPAGQALERLWRAWLGPEASNRALPPAAVPSQLVRGLAVRCAALWERGRDLGLWQPRHPMMPLWQRGARGLEFWELARLSGALARWAGDDARDEELKQALEPILTQGEAVLRAQADLLDGRQPEAEAARTMAAWFPRPRRVGGDWAAARELLEKALLRWLRNA